MPNFDEIEAAIKDKTSNPSRALEGKYHGDSATDPTRKFLAYVLGKSHAKPGVCNSVLAYQYAGFHTSQDDLKKWRCFKVDSFIGSVTQIPFNPPAGLSIPDPLTTDQVNRQNCVDIPAGRIVRDAKYHPPEMHVTLGIYRFDHSNTAKGKFHHGE